MKTFSLIALALLFSGAASAKPLASLSQTGGFCHPRCADTTVTIEDNGFVSVERRSYAPVQKVEKIVLLTLNQKVVNKVRAEVQSMTVAPLIDSDPSGPFCADLPSKTFVGFKGNSQIKFGEDRDCHHFRLPTFAGNALAEQLDGFLSLYYYGAL